MAFYQEYPEKISGKYQRVAMARCTVTHSPRYPKHSTLKKNDLRRPATGNTTAVSKKATLDIAASCKMMGEVDQSKIKQKMPEQITPCIRSQL
jgi:hypothetical protein